MCLLISCRDASVRRSWTLSALLGQGNRWKGSSRQQRPGRKQPRWQSKLAQRNRWEHLMSSSSSKVLQILVSVLTDCMKSFLVVSKEEIVVCNYDRPGLLKVDTECSASAGCYTMVKRGSLAQKLTISTFGFHARMPTSFFAPPFPLKSKFEGILSQKVIYYEEGH
jgi:hypothetical protein